MKPDSKTWIAMFAVLVFSTLAFAEPPTYRIGTFPVPRLVENETKGVFVELFGEIGKRTGGRFEIVLRPPKRIRDMFRNEELIGFFPALDPTLNKTVCKTEPFFVKRGFAFVRKDRPLIRTIRELEGKTVGLTLGYSYPPEITSGKKIRTDYAPNEVLNMKKLAMGRVDVVVSEEISGSDAVKESGETNIRHDPGIPIYQHDVFFAFQTTAEGKAICEKFSAVISEMKKDGTLEKILSHYPDVRCHDGPGKEK